MPPVRWKRFAATTMCLLQVIVFTNAQLMQEAISMTADGWRPIIGTPKIPPYRDEILHYRNQNGESVKAETPSSTRPPSSTLNPTTKHPTHFPFQSESQYVTKKVALHTKPVPLNWGQPSHVKHGPHIPLGGVTHGPQNYVTRPNQVKKFPTSSKPFMQVSSNGKRHNKPARVQGNHNHNREEIFLGSHSQNPYSFYKPQQNTVKTRETIGLGIPGAHGGSHYQINQPHAHIEFNNRYALPSHNSESIFQHYNPAQSFFFQKPPQSNDINFNFQAQNDDFTRNLVPPPPLYKEKPQKQVVKETPKPHILLSKPRNPEKVSLQVPPPFEYNSRPNPSEPPVQVQVTKEKLSVFHNNIPASYSGDYIIDYDFHNVKRPSYTESPKIPTYEVTENKNWQQEFVVSQLPSLPRGPPPSLSPFIGAPTRSPEVELNVPPFLPTPYRPEGQAIVPTSPTQSEVSTIFTKLSKLQKEKDLSTQNPSFFSVKEVSTHYPILGKPVFEYDISTPEISNDITTTNAKPAAIEEVIPPTRDPPQNRPHRRRRPNLRQRPTTSTSTSTTTEETMEMDSYELQKTQEDSSSDSVETERPLRQRRPTRYRTNTPHASEEISSKLRTRNRYRTRPTQVSEDSETSVRKRLRPVRLETITEMPANHKTEDNNSSDSMTEMSDKEAEETSQDEEVVYKKPSHFETEPPEYPAVIEESKINYETVRQPHIEQAEYASTPFKSHSDIHIPENEVNNVTPSSSTVKTEEDETTVEVSTTTSTSTTTRPSRLRTRPVKYDSSIRPRFSVKEYRQKLNQYSSSTSTSTTTEAPHRSTSESFRLRFPNRARRPYNGAGTSSTTTQSSLDLEDNNTEPVRSKFVPKDARHTTESVITEKNVKAVNTRLRPFGRYRSTTAATTPTPKMSMRPNLFTKRRRLPPISLKTRLFNAKNKTEEKVAETTTITTTSTEENQTEQTVLTEYQTSVEDAVVAATTETSSEKPEDTGNSPSENFDETEIDMMKNDPFLYSQRVSDLTSSAKNDYNTPGLFKSVSPTSRRIPNYFTIATDDPILPIEAFFPNIKDGNKSKDSK